MRYLIITKNEPPFYTKWFDEENHYQKGMTVIDLATGMYYSDGNGWIEIDEDSF